MVLGRRFYGARVAEEELMAEAKDLLRGLSGDFGAMIPAAPEEKSGDLELALGLSLGGCFSGEQTAKKANLLRSSSISFLPSLQQRGLEESRPGATLARTSSLPVETEEEQKKRKELQYLRRLEAKRKRSEKRSGSRSRISPEVENPASANLQGEKEAEAKGMMEEMPCVFTVGGGGRRVEGFLYRYKKGEEVRIVCVCHGKFFSPAEFVEHAGGGVVAHPLRHIVVNPSPSGF